MIYDSYCYYCYLLLGISVCTSYTPWGMEVEKATMEKYIRLNDHTVLRIPPTLIRDSSTDSSSYSLLLFSSALLPFSVSLSLPLYLSLLRSLQLLSSLLSLHLPTFISPPFIPTLQAGLCSLSGHYYLPLPGIYHLAPKVTDLASVNGSVHSLPLSKISLST